MTVVLKASQTRCLTETMFDEALKRAKELDEHLKKTGQPIGPLHGLPISFKVCIGSSAAI